MCLCVYVCECKHGRYECECVPVSTCVLMCVVTCMSVGLCNGCHGLHLCGHAYVLHKEWLFVAGVSSM